MLFQVVHAVDPLVHATKTIVRDIFVLYNTSTNFKILSAVNQCFIHVFSRYVLDFNLVPGWKMGLGTFQRNTIHRWNGHFIFRTFHRKDI